MSVQINGTNGLTFNDASTQNTAATGFGFKNRIINGAMMIDQRNAGASVTPTNAQYSVDRFRCQLSQASKYSTQQSSVAPAGFVNSLLFTSLSSYSLTASDFFDFRQIVEGFNIADLAWGTANASPVTLSFWVRSSLTGTFGGSLKNVDSTRSYPFSYSISAANTWQYITITIAGDTSGTWVSNNSVGISVIWGIGVGSTFSGTANAWASANYLSATGATSVVGTNGATFYITGVQLEKGSTATSFDYRPYGTELQLCQRYYYRVSNNGTNKVLSTSGYNSTTTSAAILVQFPTQMRDAPTALEQSGTASDYSVVSATSGNVTCNSVPTFGIGSIYNTRIGAPVASGLTVGQVAELRSATANAYLGFSAEL